MANKKVLGSALLLLAAGLVWFLWPRVPPTGLAPSAGSESGVATAEATLDGVGHAPEPQQSAPSTTAPSAQSDQARQAKVPATGSTAASAGLPAECHVTVLIKNPDGQGDASGTATVWAKSAEGQHDLVSEITDPGHASVYMHKFRMPPGRYTFCAESKTYGRAELTADIKGRNPPTITLEYEPVQTVAAHVDIPYPMLEVRDERGLQRQHDLAWNGLARRMRLWPSGDEWSAGDTFALCRVRPGIGAVSWTPARATSADEDRRGGAVHWDLGVLNVYRTAIESVDFLCLQRPGETRAVHPGMNELVFTIADSSLEKMTATLLASTVDADTGKPVWIGELTLRYTNDERAGGWRYGGQVSRMERYYLAPGAVLISIRSPGFATQWFQCTLMPGEETDLGTVRLEKELILRGVVKGPVPRSGSAKVTAVDLAGPATAGGETADVDWGVVGSAEWGEVGTFEIRGLSASTYLVGISSPYRGTRVSVRTDRLADPIQLEIEKSAWVEVSSRRSDERFITVRIQDSDGHSIETFQLGPSSDSHVHSCQLAYGAYDLLCTDGSTDCGTRTLRVDQAKLDVVIE